MKIVVVGGGSWGSAFACMLRDRGHAVVLACRDPEQARVIAETGRNPKYLTEVSLHGIDATTVDDAPLVEAELVVLAVPSRSFRSSMRCRICAWIVTSSAVVGSSARSTFGLHDSAMAIMTRWRIPPES